MNTVNEGAQTRGERISRRQFGKMAGAAAMLGPLAAAALVNSQRDRSHHGQPRAPPWWHIAICAGSGTPDL